MHIWACAAGNNKNYYVSVDAGQAMHGPFDHFARATATHCRSPHWKSVEPSLLGTWVQPPPREEDVYKIFHLYLKDVHGWWVSVQLVASVKSLFMKWPKHPLCSLPAAGKRDAHQHGQYTALCRPPRNKLPVLPFSIASTVVFEDVSGVWSASAKYMYQQPPSPSFRRAPPTKEQLFPDFDLVFCQLYFGID